MDSCSAQLSKPRRSTLSIKVSAEALSARINGKRLPTDPLCYDGLNRKASRYPCASHSAARRSSHFVDVVDGRSQAICPGAGKKPNRLILNDPLTTEAQNYLHPSYLK